ncbi:hypothetical protein BDF19DRAFT_445599, partial [Syncephalis fuscata]
MSLWEVKDMFNKVKNAVLNLTEMEAKVREATNNDPWGASSTLMQEIAQGTYNYQQFNEVMPFIYRRFREKEPHEWRQIYKSLVLIEFLVKNGAERVIDDCRGRLSLLKSMRSFNYIDDDGKDQGINVRNRAKELVKLLMDEDMIRDERTKAKANRAKYRGVSSSSFSSGGMASSSSSRYQGFSSESYFASRDGQRDSSDTASTSTPSAAAVAAGAAATARAAKNSPSKKTTVDKQKETKANTSSAPSNGAGIDLLLDFDAEPTPTTTTTTATNLVVNNQNGDDDDWGNFQSSAGADDDEFTDFQTATPNTFGNNNNNDNDVFGSFDPFASIAPTTSSNNAAPLLSDFGNLSIGNTSSISPMVSTPFTASNPPSSQETSKKSGGGLSLDDLWSPNSTLVSLDSLGATTKKTTSTGPSLASLAQQKPQASLGQMTGQLGNTGVATSNTGNTSFPSTMQGWDSL